MRGIDVKHASRQAAKAVWRVGYQIGQGVHAIGPRPPALPIPHCRRGL